MRKSELSVTVGDNDRNKMIYCYAINAALGETMQDTRIVSVLNRPTNSKEKLQGGSQVIKSIAEGKSTVYVE